jgi:hypothetical protein
MSGETLDLLSFRNWFDSVNDQARQAFIKRVRLRFGFIFKKLSPALRFKTIQNLP